MNNVVDIHKDLRYYDKIERSKIGIEFFVCNLKQKQYTKEDFELLQRYFNRQMSSDIDWNQTS